MIKDKSNFADLRTVTAHLSETTSTQLRTLSEYFRRNKLMWIIIVGIITFLIISGIIIGTIFIITKKGDVTITEITTTTTVDETTTITTTTTMEKTTKLTTPTTIRKTITPTTNKTTTTVRTTTTTTKKDDLNNKRGPNGTTIAGGVTRGNQSNQLSYPEGIYFDDNDQTIYIADSGNDRVVAWKYGEIGGTVVAGGNGQGKRLDQLTFPTDVVIDKKRNLLIICDRTNNRVVGWSQRNPISQQIIVDYINCYGLGMNNNGDLYVSDYRNGEVRRFGNGYIYGIIVAGGNGEGRHFNQLFAPTYIFVDRNHSVYVSDSGSDRVMKWMKDAQEGILIAGGRGSGDSLEQMRGPKGLFVDDLGNLYVTDERNHRIMRWSKGSRTGSMIAGGSPSGKQANQLYGPSDLAFDSRGNFYVADNWNSRVQKFHIDID